MNKQRAGSLWLLGVLALVGCSDAIAPEVDDALNENVALVAADAALEDLQAMTFGIGASPAALFSVASPPREVSRVVTYFDADGVAQDAYNPDLTASINIVSDMSGAVTRDSWTASVERHRELTITGLLGSEETRIANGTGNGSVQRSQRSDAEGERSYDMTSSSVIADVVRGVPRADNPYPLSGTITRTISVTIVNGPDGDVTRGRTVVITFDGSQFAAITIDGVPAGEVDLAAREGRNPIRGRGGR